jgi:hypothetical protein
MESKVIRRRFTRKPEIKEVYRRRSVSERLEEEERNRMVREQEAVEGLQQLGADVVRTTIMALPAPSIATSPRPGILSSRDYSWGRQFQNHAEIVPYMVSKRVEQEWVAAAMIMRIKRKVSSWLYKWKQSISVRSKGQSSC